MGILSHRSSQGMTGRLGMDHWIILKTSHFVWSRLDFQGLTFIFRFFIIYQYFLGLSFTLEILKD